MSRCRLGVIFGSRSVEHEVSIITACQLMKHVDREKFEAVPIYVDRQGRWWQGSEQLADYSEQSAVRQAFQPFALRPMPDANAVDVAIICCHGTYGEDGTIQGLLELAGIPYQGPGVLGSAVCMDKIVTKKIMLASSIPVVNFQWLTRSDWQENEQGVLDRLLDAANTGHELLQFPLFVKPANLGSSVGITKATDRRSLTEAIEVALRFDRRVLVEQGMEGVKEVNVSVLGYDAYIASVPEEPIATGEILSYADKYEGGGKKMGGMASLKRRIPAPIPMSLAKKLQEVAVMAARQCDVAGVVRIDFMVNVGAGEFWLNELNTIPGSMAFYLWEASGISYPELIDRLVEIAQRRRKSAQENITSIQTTIIR